MNENDLRTMLVILGMCTTSAAGAMKQMHPPWCRCWACYATTAAQFLDPKPAFSLSLMLCLGMVGPAPE
jgi:hypothetical protein